MHPELKAYLDDYYARTMARYDAMDRLQDAMLSKLLAGVPTPQPACPMGTAADDGLTDDTLVPEVIPDAFCFTTQAEEIPTVAHAATPVCIDMVPITYSTECPAQVIAIASVDEVHHATPTVCPEPPVDINDKEVEQLTPTRAPPTISTGISSLNKEAAPSVTTTVDIDPKAGVQELDALSANTFFPAPSELDYGVILAVPSNLTTPALGRCSTECPVPAGDWVKPLTATIDSADETHDTAIAKRLHPPSLEYQPWPPPVQVQFNLMGHLFRPSPWPSFRLLLVTSYPEEPCSSIHSQTHAGYPDEPYSGMHSQPHEVPWFSSGLLLFLFRDVASLRVCCWQYEQLQQWRPPDRASSWEYMASRSFPRGQTLLVIFHPSMYMEQFSSLGLQDSPGCIKSSVNCWESTPCVSIMVDAWINTRCHGTNCRTHTTATLAGCGMEASRAISCNGTFAIQANCLIPGDFINSEHTDPESQPACSKKVGNFLKEAVQLPIDNSSMVNSARSVPGYRSDLAVTNVDGMLKPTAEDNCSKGVLVKDSALDFSWEARPEQEDVCKRESATGVPTNYQVSPTKNPFNLDDTRSGDLLELASGYHLKVPNVSELEQELDSTPQTVSNQIGVADEHRNSKGHHKQDSSCCCFLLAACAPCVRDQHKVNFSTSTNALISPLSQQLDHNFGVESIFELLLHILQQTSCSKSTPAVHKLDNSNSWLDEQHWSFPGTDADTCKRDTIQALIEESGQCFSQFTKIRWWFRICLKMMSRFMVLLPCVNIDYELWRPPNRTKIVKLQSGLPVKFRRLQFFLVSSLKLQSKPAWQLTFLVTAGLSNCCHEKVLPTLKNSANTSTLLCFSCHTIASTIVGSARIQAITMASCPGFVVNTFKPLSQMQLLMVRANCARSDSETLSLFSCSLFTEWPCELIIASTRWHSAWRNVTQLIGAYLTSQQWKRTNNLKVTGLELCIRHTKVLQTAENFWGLIPTIAVGNYGSSTSVCVDEGDMPTTKKLSGVMVLRRKAPCDPGASSWHRWCTAGCDQRPFQEGRLIIPVSAFAEQAFIDQGCVNNFLMGGSISHNYCSYHVEVCPGHSYHSYSNKVHKHRVQWDPGGCQWNRLGVKPGFKKGGMSATQMLLHRPEARDNDERDPPGLLEARRGKRVDHPGLDQAIGTAASSLLSSSTSVLPPSSLPPSPNPCM